MSTLPEQFSAARTSQIEAQLQFFQNAASSAVHSAEQLLALNVSTTRASMEKSSAVVRQLLAVQDPRDLLALTKQTQQHFDSLLAYSSALFGIATGTQAALLAPVAPSVAAPPAVAPTVVEPEPVATAVLKVASGPVVVANLQTVEAVEANLEAPTAQSPAEPAQLDILTPKSKKKK